ncbi:MAG: YggS family pyridoxal phosphate-dependent enzyme [Endomicrobium sp.]|jgi:pyridoxal phosphate enzyme (YggS family)|nr:YggS family pyridoxal phosphate-dependent enzyme [Endomicrobium sp.]
MSYICQNIQSINNTIKSLEKVSGTVDLVVVTKTFAYSFVLEALKCGIKHIGESKVQEALAKFEQIGHTLVGTTKHFIGHLQSNKAKKVVEVFDLIHSLDSTKLAYDINRHAKSINKIQDCLIEVKFSKETSKKGVSPGFAIDFYKECKNLSNINIKGLMLIVPYSDSPSDSRSYFKQAYNLFKYIQESFADNNFKILSMGMSNDYKIAIEEGSTMVRIGAAIFGERNYGNK